MLNKDQVEGKWNKAKGALKEKAGAILDDEKLESEGAAENSAGVIQEGYGKARNALGETVKNIGKKIGA